MPVRKKKTAKQRKQELAAKKRGATLKKYNTTKSIFKGRLFEFILSEILKKSGFTGEFESNQITKDKKKLHGRGATYAPDFYGVFNIGIPFVNPLLLIVEAKYFNKKVGLKTVREFLGAYIDFSQYVKIDTKANWHKKYEKLYEIRYNYCPIFFSMKGYEKTAQAFMFAHGINYISYKNSNTIEKALQLSNELLAQINFATFSDTDFQKFISIESIGNIRAKLKKPNFTKAFNRLNKYFKLLNSFIAVIDHRFPINILHKGRISQTWYKKVSLQHAGDGKFYLKKIKNKTIGEFTLAKYFLKEYVTYANKKQNLENIFKHINVVIENKGKFEIKNLIITEASRKLLINTMLTIKIENEEEEQSPDEETDGEE